MDEYQVFIAKVIIPFQSHWGLLLAHHYHGDAGSTTSVGLAPPSWKLTIPIVSLDHLMTILESSDMLIVISRRSLNPVSFYKWHCGLKHIYFYITMVLKALLKRHREYTSHPLATSWRSIFGAFNTIHLTLIRTRRLWPHNPFVTVLNSEVLYITVHSNSPIDGN